MLGLDMENVRLKSNDKAHRRSAIFIQRRQERSLRLSGVIYGDSRQRKRKTGKQGVIYGDSRQRKRKTGKQGHNLRPQILRTLLRTLAVPISALFCNMSTWTSTPNQYYYYYYY
ncbi:uncharacterized protein [Montipora capricornis]